MGLFKRTPNPAPSHAINEGEMARKQAEYHLAEQRAQQPEVRRVAESLRELRQRNHFAAQIKEIFLGGNPG